MRDAQVDVHFTGYSFSIAAAGGLPVGLTRDAEVEGVLDCIDGLVLSGGDDVDPHTYGEEPRPECGPVEPERDAWELQLLAGAFDRSMPVLAICRGMQLVNVFFGGSLLQHMGDGGDRHARLEGPAAARVHRVDLVPGTLVAGVYGSSVEVNSLHHQGVDRLGGGLRVAGRSSDGTVEALEVPGRAVLAVQWHPEMLEDQPDPASSWLVEAVRAATGSGGRRSLTASRS